MQKNLDTADNATHPNSSGGKPRRQRLADLSSMGGRLAHARISVGMTQQQLADQCGVSRPVIVYTERGRSKSIKTELLQTIATLTGFRAEWIMHGTGTQKTSGDTLDQQVLETAAQMTVEELRDSLLDAALTLPADQLAILISDLEDAADA